jgi:hypothetical protein
VGEGGRRRQPRAGIELARGRSEARESDARAEAESME